MTIVVVHCTLSADKSSQEQQGVSVFALFYILNEFVELSAAAKQLRKEERRKWWRRNWGTVAWAAVLLVVVGLSNLYVHFPWIFDLRLVVQSK